MKIKYYQRIGEKISEKNRRILVEKLRDAARTCFDELPNYQCLSDDYDFKNSILTIAWDGDKIAGFSSAMELTTRHTEFLHLGLTCVSADYRSRGLTHKLAGRLTLEYLVRNKLFSRVWFSNIAGVISSLANVGKNFEDVYPSPKRIFPSKMHTDIATNVSGRYRKFVFITENIEFDEENFIFLKSAKNTAFEKSPTDKRYLHRDPNQNHFYLSWMRLDQGDEMIQVGYYNFWTFVKYLFPFFRK